jgi:hypothetical protein
MVGYEVNTFLGDITETWKRCCFLLNWNVTRGRNRVFFVMLEIGETCCTIRFDSSTTGRDRPNVAPRALSPTMPFHVSARHRSKTVARGGGCPEEESTSNRASYDPYTFRTWCVPRRYKNVSPPTRTAQRRTI